MNIDAIKRDAVNAALEWELNEKFNEIAKVAQDINEPASQRLGKLRPLLNEVEQLLAELEKQ